MPSELLKAVHAEEARRAKARLDAAIAAYADPVLRLVRDLLQIERGAHAAPAADLAQHGGGQSIRRGAGHGS